MREVKFSELVHWTPRQAESTAAADAHRFTLFGGSRGPGKSYWLRWYEVRALLRWGAQGFRGVRVMLACEDYPSLHERQINKVLTEFPPWLGLYNQQTHEYRLRAEYGAGVLAFRNLDDPTRYQSAEYAIIGVDELTKNKASTFAILRGSLRWPGIERTQFVAATNPNGMGAAWVRALWIEHQFPDELAPLKDEFCFTPGLPTDNPYLPQAYFDDLATLPTTLREAWLCGNWYAGVEGLVYDEFAETNLTGDEPDPSQPIELSLDDGYVDPRAILFIQRTGTRVLVFAELYHRSHLAETCVGEVVAMCKDKGWPLPQLAIGSPEAKELHARLRMADIPVRNNPHEVVQGIAVVRRLIRDGNGYRALQVNRRCRNLIEEITAGYQYSEGVHGDAEKPLDGNDHACEGLRHWCYTRARW